MKPDELPNYLAASITPGDHLLHITWQRSVSSEEYRGGLLAIKQLIMEQGIRLWLADSRLLSHVTFEDQQWIMKEIIPPLLKTHLHKMARVVNSDVFSYITFENLMSKAHTQYQVEGHMEQFTSVEAALDWLRLAD